MKVLFATAEAHPFIRSGGLGDVAGALPIALNQKDIDTRIILPYYQDIPLRFKQNMEFLGSTIVSLGYRNQYAGLFSYRYNDCIYYFVDNEYYFKRSGLYGHFDDGERFAFFSKAVLELMPLIDFYPNVIHCNDWQTGLIPLYLDCFYRGIDGYKLTKTVMTIHNIEFQGRMDKFVIDDVFGIPYSFRDYAIYAGDANMLKAGLEACNVITTVSNTYAHEILSPYFAYGLDSILNLRSYKLKGILNGIDVNTYNPQKDKALFQNYTKKNIAKRAINKQGLQELVNLPVSQKIPLIGMVTRLTSQKGLDLILEVINDILSLDIQMVILGTGDWKYENSLRDIEKRYPNKISIIINFSMDIASKIYAGCDFFLMPSKFEPCGLSQLIAMRYGCVPIVRETGGLKDTVPAYNPIDGSGRGFTFKTYNAYDMLGAIKRAIDIYNNDAEGFKKIISNDMQEDYSWGNSANKYIELYEDILKIKI